MVHFTSHPTDLTLRAATEATASGPETKQPWRDLTPATSSINHHGSVPQACKQEASGVLEAQHRAALWVVEGQ